jgi:MFS family permease
MSALRRENAGGIFTSECYVERQKMNLTNRRWLIFIASCLVNLCIGSLYAWSVFAKPMADYISGIKGLVITAGSLAICFTIANSVGPITMISGGSINDKMGPKKIIFTGGLLFGGGMFLSGFAQSTGFLILSYGIMAGFGVGMTYGCTIGNSIKFFPDKRGLIGGIATATYGLSAVIMPPIAAGLIGLAGISNAFKILGAGIMVIICASSFLIEKCPEGFVPDGWKPAMQNKTTLSTNKNWKEMMASPVFYIMILILVFGAFSGLMCISQASSIAQNMIGMSILEATAAVSLLALFNAAGRIVAGFVSDKIGRINTLTIAFMLSVAGLVLLYNSGQGDTIKFQAGISIIGLSFGSFMGVFPGFTADQFGSKNNTVNYGIMFIGFALAGLFGPLIMNYIYTTEQRYQRAFLAAGCLSVVGICLTCIFRLIKSKNIFAVSQK